MAGFEERSDDDDEGEEQGSGASVVKSKRLIRMTRIYSKFLSSPHFIPWLAEQRANTIGKLTSLAEVHVRLLSLHGLSNMIEGLRISQIRFLLGCVVHNLRSFISDGVFQAPGSVKDRIEDSHANLVSLLRQYLPQHPELFPLISHLEPEASSPRSSSSPSPPLDPMQEQIDVAYSILSHRRLSILQIMFSHAQFLQRRIQTLEFPVEASSPQQIPRHQPPLVASRSGNERWSPESPSELLPSFYPLGISESPSSSRPVHVFVDDEKDFF